MSGCHIPYIVGTSAIKEYETPTPVRVDFYCSCSCHQSVHFSINAPVCWCKCNTNVTRRTYENPKRSFVDECIKETKNKDFSDLKDMEDRIKTHISKIKYDILYELKKIYQPQLKPKKEIKNDSTNRAKSINE